MSTVYLILNETTFIGTDQVTTEPVEVYDDLQAAMDWIHDLAEDNGVQVEDDANSVYVPPSEGIETDEYYIIEMELKSRG
ncbi:hypothetical protein SEA_STELLA_60 [Streptomyces phage Stella]|nr:hypothetical protein SEA_STELLA_60 [Streptomyces phage Stella]